MLDIIFTEIEKYTLNLSRLYIIFTIYVFSEMFIILYQLVVETLVTDFYHVLI